MTRICSISGCDKKHYGLSYCLSHYKRFKKYGDASFITKAERGAPLAFLQANVNYDADCCLLWPFGQSSKNYGAITFQGVSTSASRAMCILAHGEPIDERNEAAHSCGTKLCVNPRHLRWATSLENVHDKFLHGTVCRGEDIGLSKLTERDVSQIRCLARRLPHADIARKFNITQTNVRSVVSGQTWRHVQ